MSLGLPILRRLTSQALKMTLDRYIWIDLEMTGLNPETDTILEVACIITEPDLNPLNEGMHFVIHQNDNVLKSMNEWCLVHHEKSGLISESRASPHSLKDVEEKLFNYIKSNTFIDGTNYLAGNSVYMDLLFLKKYMPSIPTFLHYRLIDVSSLKVLCNHWYSYELKNCKKEVSHRALDDIKNSIQELKTYKNIAFK
ncbi:oligoribonuclease, putative [Pediculus humanus corporis]|uniref:Oligoribonuclease, putative n=1 Tax=Pediculus humanus subsp. corporis TaxID=121224 RepID=E0VPC9_PEDHC|nr:oligoribonuclease, putative [Pediculus humanus corporis]EEB15235.1 oligoribonuclease, putative [Pediculus humanus corporis]